ncbi:MAG: AI-2E family transporter [Myxococcales bacterium]|nr:AI-2E family transporter [Myxococcales bacterium]
MSPTAPGRAFVPWVFIGLAVGLTYYFRDLVMLLFGAFAIAYILHPLVARLERWRVPRGVAIALSLLLSLVVLVATFVLVVPDLVRRLTELATVLPVKVRNEWIPLANGLLVDLRQRYHLRIPTTADAWINQLADRSALASRSLSVVQSAASFSLSAIELLVETLIVLAMAFYLLSDWDRIVDGGLALAPRRMANDVARIGRKVDAALGRYVRGQGLAMLILGSLFAIGLVALGVPGGLGLGVFAGLIAFIPYVGFFIALGFAALFAALDGGGSGHVFAVVAYMLFVHILDLTVVTPRILGGSIGLSPVAVILSLLAGAKVLGFVGLLVAIPVASVGAVLVHELVDYYKQTRFYTALPANAEGEVDIAIVQVDQAPVEGARAQGDPFAGEPVVDEPSARQTHQDGSGGSPFRSHRGEP